MPYIPPPSCPLFPSHVVMRGKSVLQVTANIPLTYRTVLVVIDPSPGIGIGICFNETEILTPH